MITRSVLRVATVATAGTAVVAATALAAGAHVRVYSYTPAVQGGDAALVFRVPCEEQTNTVAVTVDLPTTSTLPSVSAEQVPGWTVSTSTRTLATPVSTDDGPVTSVVSSVTWKADPGGGIRPDSYEEFGLSTEGLPKVASLAFPTVQTYANGDVVRWIEPTPASGAEPDHPVPVLDLAPAGSGESATSAAADVAGVSPAAKTEDGTARGLGIAGIVVGAVGLVAAGAALVTRRRPTR